MRPTPRSEYRQKYESPDVLEDGRWVVNRGVKVWEPSGDDLAADISDDECGDYDDAQVHAIPSELATVACPYCFATVAEHCRSKSGRKTDPHPTRFLRRVCQCGADLKPRCELCAECRAENDRVRSRENKRRARAVA